MANALSQLGYSVHDFEEHLEYNLDNYLRFFDGDLDEEVFREMYEEVDAVVDQPACTLWNIIFKQFPEAKIILMERESPETWFRSYSRMLEDYRLKHDSFFLPLYLAISKTYYKLERLSEYNMMLSTASETALRSKVSKVMVVVSVLGMKCSPVQSLWMDQYSRHNASVKALVPTSQLLVYKTGEGWERLCQFLEVQVPSTPFPHENKGGAAGNIVEKYLRFSIFQQGEREVRRGLLTLSASVALTVLAGFYVRRCLKL